MSARLGCPGIKRDGGGDRRGVAELREPIDGAVSATIIRADPGRAHFESGSHGRE